MLRRLLARFRRPKGIVLLCNGSGTEDPVSAAIVAKFRAAGYDVHWVGGAGDFRIVIHKF